jgi:hypothetical protein
MAHAPAGARRGSARRVAAAAASTRMPTVAPLTASVAVLPLSRDAPQQGTLSAQQSLVVAHCASQQQLGVAAPGK